MEYGTNLLHTLLWFYGCVPQLLFPLTKVTYPMDPTSLVYQVTCRNQVRIFPLVSPSRVVGILSEAGSASTASDLYQKAGLGSTSMKPRDASQRDSLVSKNQRGSLPVREELKNQPPWSSQLVEGRVKKSQPTFSTPTGIPGVPSGYQTMVSSCCIILRQVEEKYQTSSAPFQAWLSNAWFVSHAASPSPMMPPRSLPRPHLAWHAWSAPTAL